MDYDTISERLMQQKYRMLVSPNGVSMQSTKRIAFSKAPRAKRGTVVGFSTASRRRFRHMLMKVDYSRAVAVTLTYPAMISSRTLRPINSEFLPMRDPEVAFDFFNKHSSRFSFVQSLIWRKEVTEMGTPHYHCILIPSSDVEPYDAGRSLVEAWIGEVCVPTFPDPKLSPEDLAAFNILKSAHIDKCKTKMRKAHYNEKRPSIRLFDDSTGYVRYLLDHQSKHKDYQAKTTGRPWGIWKRKNLPTSNLTSFELSESEFWRVGRVLQKIARYKVEDKRSVFGWRHSFGRRTQGHGTTDYFGRLADGSLAGDIRRYLDALRGVSK